MTENTHTFSSFKVTQPIGELFVAKLPYDVIVKCSNADIRKFKDRKVERVAGIQRLLNTQRVKEIHGYVNTVDATFPNSIIMNLNSKYLKNDISESKCEVTSEKLYIFDIIQNENCFEIIDGQHRLAGLEGADIKNFEIIIAFFVDLVVEEQAYIFSTINTKQSKVNKSLVIDLFGLSNHYVPQKCAHLITKNLNSNVESPLYRRISLLGVATKFNDELIYQHLLTQGTVASKILKYISDDPTHDRDQILRGIKLEYTDGGNIGKQIFRKYYLEEKDWVIFKILKNYFNSVSIVFENEWNEESNPLSRTIGFSALMKLLEYIYKNGVQKSRMDSKYFIEMMKIVRMNFEKDNEIDEISFTNFEASGKGENRLFNKLLEWSELSKLKI